MFFPNLILTKLSIISSIKRIPTTKFNNIGSIHHNEHSKVKTDATIFKIKSIAIHIWITWLRGREFTSLLTSMVPMLTDTGKNIHNEFPLVLFVYVLNYLELNDPMCTVPSTTKKNGLQVVMSMLVVRNPSIFPN